jgi:hypothetical protein
LLFKIPREQVLMEGTEARREFDSLSRGIESNDRIRPLAVNPLLLTVIAIVHWNRKRFQSKGSICTTNVWTSCSVSAKKQNVFKRVAGLAH